MEYIMNLSLWQKAQLVCYMANDIGNQEGSIAFCLEFCHRMTCFQICCFKPDLLTQGIGLKPIGFG